jgi:hypothetical protein
LGQAPALPPAEGAGAPAADPSQAPQASEQGPTAADELALEQSRLADKYAKLEQLMLKMAELEGMSNPKRAQLLMRAVEQSKQRLTKTQMETLVTLLHQRQLKRAAEGQASVSADLKALLDLLMSEDRSDRLKSEQQRIREYLKEVERLIRLQRSLQGQTEGGGDARRLAQEQGRIAGQTGDLARKIRENEEEAARPGDAASPQAQSDPSQRASSPQGASETPRQPSGADRPGTPNASPNRQEPSPAPREPRQPGERDSPMPPSPAGQQGQPSPQDAAQPRSPQGQGSQGPPSQQGQQDQKGQQDQQGQQGQQGQSQPGQQGQQGQQGQGEQEGSPPSAQESNPARQRLEQAQQRMEEARRRLEQARRKESVQEQQAAREELEKAKAELERILRQLREEEIARTLAQLEARFRKMLEMQLAVYEGTRRLDQVPPERRGEPFLVQSGRLAADQQKIVAEANKTLTLLQEEGSSVAFPATVEQMRDDMRQVADRLAETRIDEITLGLEEDIIAALEELITALQKAQRDREREQQQPQQQQQNQDQEEPLVDQIAELKMIKSLQERVNKRTQRYARLLVDENDPLGVAEAPELAAALRQLSERQQEIFRITRDIVLGKNQ